jgi:hypothetical protein
MNVLANRPGKRIDVLGIRQPPLSVVAWGGRIIQRDYRCHLDIPQRCLAILLVIDDGQDLRQSRAVSIGKEGRHVLPFAPRLISLPLIPAAHCAEGRKRRTSWARSVMASFAHCGLERRSKFEGSAASLCENGNHGLVAIRKLALRFQFQRGR